MDDRFVAGNLGLRIAKAKTKHAGEIEPIQTDNEVCLFDESGSVFARAQARRGQMQRMSSRKRRRVVAAGQYGGANRLGKAHPVIPVGLLARNPAHENQRKLCLLDRGQSLLQGFFGDRGARRGGEPRRIGNRKLLGERRLLQPGIETNVDRAIGWGPRYLVRP